jgi:uncharacterized protein YcfJ
MSASKLILSAAFAALIAASGCTDNQSVNTGMGALAGAAVGSQIGGGSGRTAAMITGAAIGGVAGSRVPTN